MPIYEYRCEECEKDVEAIQKFSDPQLTDCPSCGAPKLKRLLSQSSFALKGSGWYADGYGGKAAKSSEDAPVAKEAVAKEGVAPKEGAAAKTDGAAAKGDAKPEKEGTDSAGSKGSGAKDKTSNA